MIQVNQLTYYYPQSVPIFQDFTWQVEKGETWTLLGPSGCGKTTLLYLLAGLKLPVSGEIIIEGNPIIRPRPRTGLILQDYGLLPWATVRQNSRLGLKVREFYGPDGTHSPRGNEELLDSDIWLERLGIASLADKYPAQISGGQRQRVAIARTLALQPDLLLMDEPFSSLDAVTRSDLQLLTLELCTENTITMIVVTHDIEEAVELGKKILVLGQQPNSHSTSIENPGAGEPHYYRTRKYRDTCQLIRQTMVSS
jgi:NitT/TauT family transport system ATP-binding protein